MSAGHRWLLALSLAIVITGLAGIATLHPSRGHPTRAASHSDQGSGRGGPAPGGAVPGRAASPSALTAQLLGPAQLKGFVQGSARRAEAQLDSAPCLLGLGPSRFQAGRAITSLTSPGPGAGPAVTEVVASYPATAAAPVFGSVAAALQACPEFALSLAGTAVVVALNAATMPPIANASRLYQGRFRLAGRMEQLDVVVVLDGQDVLGLVYVDTVPASGGLVATIRAAAGRLT